MREVWFEVSLKSCWWRKTHPGADLLLRSPLFYFGFHLFFHSFLFVHSVGTMNKISHWAPTPKTRKLCEVTEHRRSSFRASEVDLGRLGTVSYYAEIKRNQEFLSTRHQGKQHLVPTWLTRFLCALNQSINQSINQNTLFIPEGNCFVTVAPCKYRSGKN